MTLNLTKLCIHCAFLAYYIVMIFRVSYQEPCLVRYGFTKPYIAFEKDSE